MKKGTSRRVYISCSGEPGNKDDYFQHFLLADTFPNRELAPEWELDVALWTQLASFPTTWNLGNSVLPVNTYWAWFNAGLIDQSSNFQAGELHSSHG